MGEETINICIKFGQRLNKFKKRAKIYYATQISENHIKKTVAGKVNAGILHIESYARLFGVEDYEMLNYNAPIPNREDLQDNIQAHFASIGYTSSENFKKLGPSYIVEEFIEELGAFSEPLEAVQLKDLCNTTKGTSYNTNDVARVLNKLDEEGILKKIDTGNAKKPKYDKKEISEDAN